MPNVPPHDDELNRERFYADLDDEDDGQDYELEPIDPEVLERERRMAEAEVKQAETRVAIARVEAETRRSQDFDDLVRDFKFQFQVKHLLMGTAGLAIFLSVGRLLNSSFAAAFLLVLALLVAGHTYFGWRDKRRRERLAAERARLVSLSRAKPDATANDAGAAAEFYQDETDEPVAPRPKLRIAFSLREVMIALTVGAVVLGLLQLMGAGMLSAVLGLVAIAGLAAYATGFDAPPALVLGWWVTLLLYIGVSFIGAVLPGG